MKRPPAWYMGYEWESKCVYPQVLGWSFDWKAYSLDARDMSRCDAFEMHNCGYMSREKNWCFDWKTYLSDTLWSTGQETSPALMGFGENTSPIDSLDQVCTSHTVRRLPEGGRECLLWWGWGWCGLLMKCGKYFSPIDSLNQNRSESNWRMDFWNPTKECLTRKHICKHNHEQMAWS